MERSTQPTPVPTPVTEGWDFRFSNFAPFTVKDEYGIKYPNVEAAYQASKTANLHERERIAYLPGPGAAKRAGRMLKLRPEWESVKLAVMKGFLDQKYQSWTLYGQNLMTTGDTVLVETNHWHDNIWGDCVCGRLECAAPGQNWLGHLLMLRRSELLLEVALAT